MSESLNENIVSKTSLFNIFQASQMGLAMLNKENFFVEITNESFCKELGMQTSQLIGRNFMDVIFVGYEHKFLEMLAEFDTGKKSSSSEIVLRHANGNRVYFHCMFELSTFGGVNFVGGIFNNITEKKIKELEQAESQTQLSALYGLLDDVIIVVDIHGTYLNIAPTATNFFYKDPKKLEGKRLNELFPDENAIELTKKIRYAIESGHSLYFEYNLPINNIFYWFNMSIKPISGHKALVVARDISQNKKIELQLEKINSFSQDVLSKIPNSIYIYDFEENRLVYINDSHKRLTGYEKELILNRDSGTLVPELVHPEDYGIIGEALAKVKTIGDQEVLEYVYRSRHAGGHWIWVQDSISVFKRNLNGEVTQIISCSIDVSENQLFKQSLSESKALLKENNRMFETLLDNLPGIVCRFSNDIDWTMKFISEACEPLTGYKSSDFLEGRISLGKISHPLDNEYVYDAIQAALLQKRTYQVYYRIRNKAGEERWLSEQGKGIFDENGELEVIEAYINDITENRQSEQKLLRSEERFRSITEAVTLPLMISRVSDGKIMYANQYFSNMVGLAKEDLIFKYSKDFYFDISKRHKVIRDYLELGKIQEFEVLGKKVNGEQIWLLVNGNIIQYNGEEAICSTFNDITERKKSEEALRNSEAKISSLINNTMDFILSIDKEFHITAMNDPLKQVLLQSTGEDNFTGISIFEIIPKDRHKSTIEKFEEVLLGKKVVVEHLISLQTEGQVQYVEDSYNPIKNAIGEVEGISIFTRDITERRISEIQLKNTLKELKERNFELDTFVYKVSHDLRAPLRSVLGLVNLMNLNKDPETQKLCLSKIEESMQRMDTFIQTVLVYSRTLNNGLEVRKINFRIIIEECVDELKYTKDSEKISLSLDLVEESEFENDYFRLTIIFKNFISNAIKYMNHENKHNTLDFKIHVNERLAEIEIKDNGIGMDESIQSKIFEMFYRGTERSDSSGLGLYIVKLNIEKLDGTIEVESKPLVGTTFRLRIPNKLIL